MSFTNDDKIIVTGASSGIGQAIAWQLNTERASVIAIGRSLDRLQETKNNAKYPESIYIEQKDLLDDVDNLPNYVKYLRDKYGKFKAIACVAGVDKVLTINMLNKKDIDDIFTINYTVPMMLAKGFADKRNNVGEGANILFVSSIGGVYPDKGQIVYGASKAALIASTTAISKEIALRKMRCNCISPAQVKTPMYEKQKQLGVVHKELPLEVGKPSDVSNLACFLMSDSASWITGSNYMMTGGIY